VKARLPVRSFSFWLTRFAVCAVGVLHAAEPSVAPGINDRYATEEGRKTAIQIFEGEGRDLKPGGRLIIVDWHRKQNEIFDRWGIDAKQHLRLDREGVVREIESHGWKNVDSRSFLEHQFFLVFEPR
jgi:predicted methyltransferase